MISVVIPAKDAEDTLEECLQATLSQEGLDQDYEVIVVDDGSTDETAAIAKRFGVQLIQQSNAGPAAARNTGALAAGGEIVAFTDADCVPAPDWLAQLCRPFNDPQVVGAKGTYRTHNKSLVARFVQQEYEQKYQRLARQPQIDFIDTYSAAYRRDVFLQNGGFDITFPVPSAEDVELSFRLAHKGYVMVFAPEAMVYHQHDNTIGEYLRRKYPYGYWRAYFLHWMPEKALSDSHTPASLRWQILLLGMAGFLSALAIVWPLSGWLALGFFGAFYLTALPLLGQIARRDRAVLMPAPLLLLCRAAALGAGLLVGILRPPSSDLSRPVGLSFNARIFKRLMDIIGASVGLLFSAPILPLAAAAIKLDSPGPVFFRQERIGAGGNSFQIIKLRSMVDGAEHELQSLLDDNALEGPIFKIPDDPRITRVGRLLRRWSLDEIPQFWNVLKGEMSLVGPRPEVPSVVEQFDDRQRSRLAIKPGITGPMQVSGRGELNLYERTELELDYMHNYSLKKDLEILLRSFPAVIKGKGAY